MTEKLKNREVIFEFTPIGGIMRVAAVDVATGTEAIVQCPQTLGEAGFQRAGLQKLEYVLRKNGVIT